MKLALAVRSLLVLGVLSCAPTSIAFAEDPVVAPREEIVAITSTDDIVSAYGVVFAPGEAEAGMRDEGVGVRRECEIRNKGGAQWELVLKLEPEDFRSGSRLTAVAATSSGKIIASRIRPLDTQSASVVEAKCAASEDPKYLAKLLALDESKLRALVEIRRKKRELLQIRLKELLTPAVVKRLEALEGELGYGGEGSLGGRTTPSALARRVSTVAPALEALVIVAPSAEPARNELERVVPEDVAPGNPDSSLNP